MAHDQQKRSLHHLDRRRALFAWLFDLNSRSEHVAWIASSPNGLGKPGYRFDATWSVLDEHCGVLELHEHFANLRLSLFLAVPFEGGETCWWWTTQDGVWLGEARVGLA
jgi:hypothetical protein